MFSYQEKLNQQHNNNQLAQTQTGKVNNRQPQSDLFVKSNADDSRSNTARATTASRNPSDQSNKPQKPEGDSFMDMIEPLSDNSNNINGILPPESAKDLNDENDL